MGYTFIGPRLRKRLRPWLFALRWLKQDLQKKLVGYGTLGLAATTLVNFNYRKIITPAFKVGGPLMGLTMGCIFGIIRNTEFMSRRFTELGPDYELGRYVLEELTPVKLNA